jgi:hypothetical protein
MERNSTEALNHYYQEVLGRINILHSSNTKRAAYKATHPTILRCREEIFSELFPNSGGTQTGPLFPIGDSCHPDVWGSKFLRNIGSYKSHTA